MSQTSLDTRARTPKAFTLVELLVVIAIIAILIGLTVPAVQKVRESSGRAKCGNNLKQIVLGLHTYNETYKRFPCHSGGNELCWMSKMLPHIDSGNLLTATQSDPKYYNTPVPLFLCPSDPRSLNASSSQQFLGVQYAMTSYLGVVGKTYPDQDGMFGNIRPNGQMSGIKVSEVTDGTGNTIFVGERPPGGAGKGNPDPLYWGWWALDFGDNTLWAIQNRSPTQLNKAGGLCPSVNNFGPGSVNNDCDVNHFWSPHNSGAHFAFVDGSVRFLEYSIGSTTFPFLATRAGGEQVDLP